LDRKTRRRRGRGPCAVRRRPTSHQDTHDEVVWSTRKYNALSNQLTVRLHGSYKQKGVPCYQLYRREPCFIMIRREKKVGIEALYSRVAESSLDGNCHDTTVLHVSTRWGSLAASLVPRHESSLLQNICTCDLIHPWTVIPKGHTPWEHLYIYYPACNKETPLSFVSVVSPFATEHCNRTQHVISTVSRRNQRRGRGRTRCS
jgi:hypothetical protein